MSIVVPFRALRPTREFAAAVAALPYDVMSVEEARRVVQDNPRSFLRVEKAECDLPPGVSGSDDAVVRRAKENLEAMRREKTLLQDAAPSFYIYRQQMGDHVQTGIAACVSVEEYRAGRIKTHEHTLEGKERERTLHIDGVGAHTGPVFLTYRGDRRIDSLVSDGTLKDHVYDFTADDGVRHTVWAIDDESMVKALRDAFQSVAALYIADGHHRAAAAARAASLGISEERQFMLAVLFPAGQLRIMDYNRAVRDLNGLDKGAFLARIEADFLIEENFAQKKPGRPHQFGMYLDGRWRLLSAREKTLRATGQSSPLDVSILQQLLLGPVLGIENPRTDARISFIGGIRGASALESVVDGDGFAVSFSLFPPSVEEMMAVADAGMVMPPKSTWFEPKLRSGLFVHLLDQA
jgi:uncharacterized protein (DUF1015 family)